MSKEFLFYCFGTIGRVLQQNNENKIFSYLIQDVNQPTERKLYYHFFSSLILIIIRYFKYVRQIHLHLLSITNWRWNIVITLIKCNFQSLWTHSSTMAVLYKHDLCFDYLNIIYELNSWNLLKEENHHSELYL